MIRALGTTLFNLQQMSTQQAVHVALSLPLDCGSRKCVFTNTYPLEKCKLEHGFTFGPPEILLKYNNMKNVEIDLNTISLNLNQSLSSSNYIS